MIKVRHAEEFLDKGNKVKAQLQFRGRELSHKELGYPTDDSTQRRFGDNGQAEMEPKLMGKSISMTISPLPISKRKRRFAPPDEELPPNLRTRRNEAHLFDIDGTLLTTDGAGRAALRAAGADVFAIEEDLQGVAISGNTDVAIVHEILNKHGIPPRKLMLTAISAPIWPTSNSGWLRNPATSCPA